jgi:glycosyltransferase involved in cell wall biosynthesis
MTNKGRRASNIPKISLGMPVYNGRAYIIDALDSILAQTFDDFELIISDNASTDNTGEICKEYAAKDRRVRYFRNDVNIGASKNFNRAFQLSFAEYFKWVAHDDLLNPDYLSKCMQVLQGDESIVLCYSNTARIDENGHITGDYPSDNAKVFDSRKVSERFREVTDMRHWNMVFYGLIRSGALSKTRLLGGYVGSDRTLTAELALLGRLYKIPEPLFFRREHPEASTQKLKIPQERYSWFESGKTSSLCFPNWRYGIEFISEAITASAGRPVFLLRPDCRLVRQEGRMAVQ